MNICFEYLYRDASNYKNYGDIIITNNKGINLETLDQKIKEALIDREYFHAELADIPSLKFDDEIESEDHEWHEYVSITETSKSCSHNVDILELITLLSKPQISEQGWG